MIRNDQTFGVVESIDDQVAVVLVGEEAAAWDFPAHLLPRGTGAGSVIELEPVDGRYRVLGLGPNQPLLEDIRDRELNRRRPIVVPLPHRPAPPAQLDFDIDHRPSRLSRRLAFGH